MEIIERLRSAAKTFFVQMELHGRLAKVEWEEEKNRLQKLAGMTLIGLAFLICSMIFVGFFIVAFAWDTQYRYIAIGVVTLLYAIGLLVSYLRIKELIALGSATFAATREEVSADIELIRSRL